jgi:hypothetical protein
MHLDVSVSELDDAVARAVALGGGRPATNHPHRCGAFSDPAGRPFCLTTVTPD